MSDYFVDVLGNAVISGGVVRLEFMRLASVDQNTKKANFELSHRIVMPMEGFLRSLALQEGLRNKLVADGVLKVEKSESAKPG